MQNNQLRRALSVFLVGGLLLAPSMLFTGCIGGDGDGGSSLSRMFSEDGVQGLQKKQAALAPYIEATNAFNGKLVTFDYAISPTLADLRSGTPMVSCMLPGYGALKENLEKARADKATSGVYSDIDEAADATLAILKDLVPVAEKLDNYYSSKGYLADNYAQGTELAQQFLPLHDQFTEAYKKMDAIVSEHNKEVHRAQFEELKKAGKENAATFSELNIKLRELADALEDSNFDTQAVETQIKDITAMSEKLNGSEVNRYKSDINRYIGAVRTFLANRTNDKYNDMVEEYNDLIDTANHIDPEALDKK